MRLSIPRFTGTRAREATVAAPSVASGGER